MFAEGGTAGGGQLETRARRVALDNIWKRDWTQDLEDGQQQIEEQWQAFKGDEKKNEGVS